jgi:hypothetical protein
MSAIAAYAPSRVAQLSRPAAVAVTVAAGVVVNRVLCLLGALAGASFVTVDNGTATDVAPIGVIVMTVVPLTIGMALAAALSLKWRSVIRVAQVVAPVLALGTIALTINAHFDGPSTTVLASMHIALVPITIAGLEILRRR